MAQCRAKADDVEDDLDVGTVLWAAGNGGHSSVFDVRFEGVEGSLM